MKRADVKQEGAFEADEAELKAIRNGITSLTAAAQDEIMSEEAADLVASLPNTPSWEKLQVGAERIVGPALESIQARSESLKGLYPFANNGNALSHAGGDMGFYEFCLATSFAASRPKQGFQKLVRAFEGTVRDLLKCLLGGDSVGVRFGWPTDTDWDDPPTRFPEKVNWLKSRCNFDGDEWSFDPSRRLAARRKTAKDAKIDVVVRRSHGDDRAGGITVLGQCGCGINDVDSSSAKPSELSHQWLNTFFARSAVPRPILVFATSQHVVNENDLFYMQMQSDSIVLDRIRLCLLAQKHPDVFANTMPRLRELTNYVRDNF